MAQISTTQRYIQIDGIDHFDLCMANSYFAQLLASEKAHCNVGVFQESMPKMYAEVFYGLTG